jgi:molybdopterin converting factor small subunit
MFDNYTTEQLEEELNRRIKETEPVNEIEKIDEEHGIDNPIHKDGVVETLEDEVTGAEMQDNTPITVGVNTELEVPATLEEATGTQEALSSNIDERFATMQTLLDGLLSRIDEHSNHFDRLFKTVEFLNTEANTLVTPVTTASINTDNIIASAVSKLI